MEEKNLMEVNDEIETIEEEVEENFERSGIGTGWAMLIGSGLTLAAIAAGRKAKKMWQDHKAKKEMLEEDAPVIEVEAELVDEPVQTEIQEEKTKTEKKKK